MRTRTTRLLSLLLLGLAATACGDDSSDSSDSADSADSVDGSDADASDGIDAPPADASVDGPVADAPMVTVVTVTCPGSPALTVTTPGPGNVFSPSTGTIPVNGIVRFDLGPSHNVVPVPGQPSDPGFRVPFGGDVCLQFTAAGAFNYQCQPHAPGMRGTITVE